MKQFILDCSVALSWCFEDECDEYSLNILNSFQHYNAIVPSLWNLEIINALLTAEKRNRISLADSTRFLELLNTLPIYVSDLSFSNNEILCTARNNKLTSYDTVYLSLAMHIGSAIATKDMALREACVKNGINCLLDLA